MAGPDPPPEGGHARRPPDPGPTELKEAGQAPARTNRHDDLDGQTGSTGTDGPATPPALVTAHRSYAAAVQTAGPDTGNTTIPTIRQRYPNWDPMLLDKLERTLNRDWAGQNFHPLTANLARLKDIATTPSKVHSDGKLRTRTTEETEALLAYLRGDISLTRPPFFLKATMPVLQRAIIDHFHGRHVEATLAAEIPPPPQVPLRKHMTTAALLKELRVANGDVQHGAEFISALERDVKSVYFDGHHFLHLIFGSKATANRYVETTLRLQRVVIELEDMGTAEDGVYTASQLRRRYSIKVAGATVVGLPALLAALSQLAELPILDTEIPTGEDPSADQRSFTIVFDQPDCPRMLRGVTRVQIGRWTVVLHHHQRYRRQPCGRCFSPKHTAGFCKTKPEHLRDARNRGLRTFTGQTVEFTGGEEMDYSHTSGESFEQFITLLQHQLEVETGTADRKAATLRQEGRAEVPGASTSTRNKGKTQQTSMEHPDATYTNGDFIVKRARSAPPPRDHHGGDVTHPHTSGTGNGNASDVDVVQAGGGERMDRGSLDVDVTREQDKDAKPETDSTLNYGRFQVLMEDGSQSDDEDMRGDDQDYVSEGGKDEADYAYNQEDDALITAAGDSDADMDDVPHITAEDASMEREKASCTEQTVSKTRKLDQEEEVSDPKHVEGKKATAGQETGCTDDDTLMEVETNGTSYVGSSAPTHTLTPVATPGSEFAFSLASNASDLRSDQLAQPVHGTQDAMATGCTSRQSDVAVHEKTIPARDNPIQAGQWLSWFNGTEVKVPDNGQCAVLALYATVTNHNNALQLTAPIVKEASFHKRAIYTMMVTNLRADHAIGILDPQAELKRLYPKVPPPRTQELALVQLCYHLLKERGRGVDVSIPGTFWATPHVLRASAQYFRLPLVVLDTNAGGDAHAQIYTYVDQTANIQGENEPIQHETGSYTALTDEDASLYFQTCGRLHVLPTFPVLKYHERHFYGVRHREQFLHWNAEGDPTFAATVTHQYEWLQGCLDQPDGITVETVPNANAREVPFRVLQDGTPIDLRADTDDVNNLLYTCLSMRQRLDVVHLRMDWPILDDAQYDVETLEDIMRTEINRIHVDAGLIDEWKDHQNGTGGVSRFRSDDRLHDRTYRDLLETRDLTDIAPAHNVKLQKALAANGTAAKHWFRGYWGQGTVWTMAGHVLFTY
ncbi:hypothetical protein DVH05_027947 [Phytophthora capsici]|nr:hypothetical protein DVH05_027947 [Phytophthora capsici]